MSPAILLGSGKKWTLGKKEKSCRAEPDHHGRVPRGAVVRGKGEEGAGKKKGLREKKLNRVLYLKAGSSAGCLEEGHYLKIEKKILGKGGWEGRGSLPSALRAVKGKPGATRGHHRGAWNQSARRKRQKAKGKEERSTVKPSPRHACIDARFLKSSED